MNTMLTGIKTHEKLLIVILALSASLYGGSKILDAVDRHDQRVGDIAKAQAAADASKVTQDNTANQLLLSQLATLQQQIVAQNQRIDQAMATRATQTQKQKQVDDNATSAELAARIHKLLGVGTITVTQQASNLPDELTYSLAAAHQDADNLEDLAQAKADVIDLTTKVDSCKTLTDKQADTITGLNLQIADGKTALTSEQKSHADDVKTLTNEKRKSWLNGFKWGAIAGFVGGLFVPKIPAPAKI